MLPDTSKQIYNDMAVQFDCTHPLRLRHSIVYKPSVVLAVTYYVQKLVISVSKDIIWQVKRAA